MKRSNSTISTGESQLLPLIEKRLAIGQKREVNVIQMLKSGKSSFSFAQHIEIAETTVRTSKEMSRIGQI